MGRWQISDARNALRRQSADPIIITFFFFSSSPPFADHHHHYKEPAVQICQQPIQQSIDNHTHNHNHTLIADEHTLVGTHTFLCSARLNATAHTVQHTTARQSNHLSANVSELANEHCYCYCHCSPTQPSMVR